MHKYKTVNEFLNDLTHDKQVMVDELREIILSTQPNLSEHIKWNSPSYALNGEDRITFNLHDQNKVRLILHCGTARKEDKEAKPILQTSSILPTWISDSRAIVSFSNISEIKESKTELQSLLFDWLLIKLD